MGFISFENENSAIKMLGECDNKPIFGWILHLE